MRAKLCVAAMVLLLGSRVFGEDVEVERGTLKVAMVSMKSLYTDGADAKENAANLKTNIERHYYFINKAIAKGANFVAFPECSLTGNHFSDLGLMVRLRIYLPTASWYSALCHFATWNSTCESEYVVYQNVDQRKQRSLSCIEV